MNRRSLLTFARRVLPLACLWWLLAGRDGGSWFFGGPVVLMLAAWQLEAGSERAYRVRLRRLVGFVSFFVWRTLAGSCDVAWRAIHRRLPIAPVVADYSLRLPVGGPARVFFANCINLLPGTLSAAWEDDVLRVHVLTAGPHATEELRSLERQVALLFGLPWRDCREDARE